jgi:hypothetical protein
LIQNVEIFIGIAHIAGIFIGFAALISIIRRDEIEHYKLSRIRAVVQIGLMVVVGALIPIGFGLYGFSGHILWFICSLIFLALNWLMGILSILNPENREAMIAQMRINPLKSVLFWVLFEFPLQASLILIILGLFPDIEHAFYTTALFFNLFEAIYTLVQLVYSQGSSSKS